jgi:Type ISP C-terminal specificity domain
LDARSDIIVLVGFGGVGTGSWYTVGPRRSPNEALRNIHTFSQLIKFLRDEMGWPIESEGFEELTFDYTPEELGIDAASAAKIEKNGIKRLRPLSANQPWGIFFVKFEPKRLPVVALRRILSWVVLKKRASANSAERSAWQADDLLFVSYYGEGDERQISFAHFSQDGHKSGLATLKVLGWDAQDTPLHLDDVADKLITQLSWPRDEQDAKSWRERWSSAFTLRHREVITTSKALAARLADLAQSIRAHVNAVLRIESDKGPLRKLHVSFREALIHDLSEDDFADMYAQTIAYGLLTARVSRPSGLVAENLREMVLVANPFLRDLLESFWAVGGWKGKVNFDELGISDVVQLLRDADREAVLRDFGDRNPKEDPAIHLYELFLKEYDPKKRLQRGVFYTPHPVVSYIVRSVHELLQTEFGLEDGLASTVTWGEMAAKHPGLKIPDGVSSAEPFVVILDPATGTATFLVEVVDVIHRTLTARWTQQRLTEVQQRAAWNKYVPVHLLPRLHAYELMMAPYAFAHMKIGLKLFETGYRFGSDERARIYLTNSLEPPSDDKKQRKFEEWAPALTHEAQAVNAIKRHQRFTVVIGNPPYSKVSGNLGEHAVRLIEPFRWVNGERIIERGALALELNLQDDYVKFWALLRQELLTTNVGVGAYITNSRYLASPTLRGLRWNFKELFDRGNFLDLGGQVSERSSNVGLDENVFDIEQGVAIGIGVRRASHSSMNHVNHGRYRGSQNEKYSLLNAATISSVERIVPLSAPFFRFSRAVDESETQFSSWHELNEIMPFNSGCIITSRDNLALDFDKTELLSKINRFAASARGDRAIEIELDYSCKAKWDVEACKASIRNDSHRDRRVRRVLYRPFDERWIYYSTTLLDTPSKPVSDSIFEHENLVMLTPKVKTSETFNHVLVARTPAEKKSCSHDRATQMFPLHRHESDLLKTRQSNVGGAFSSGVRAVAGNDATPEAIFAYIYGVLHSPEYRRRFGNALRDSYPRIPVASDLELFRALSHLGQELIAFHLLESPKLDAPLTAYTGRAKPEVEKITYQRNTVWLDKSLASGFSGVSDAAWNFHIGGYPVCEKWLKDRRGRTLSKGDIAHYQKIIIVLSETIRVMAEIDNIIEAHGGWPVAFASSGKSN